MQFMILMLIYDIVIYDVYICKNKILMKIYDI